jgi:cobalt-zinc-cadmium efflux system outer membrane protein
MIRAFLFACVFSGTVLASRSAFAVDWQNSQSVIDSALASSPSLRVIDARLAAARARQGGAGTLPNPTLSAGVQNQQVDFSTDPMMTMYVVGASQTFIRRERRDALRRGSASEVTRIEREADSLRAEIARDVLLAWDEAAAAENQLAGSDEIDKLAATIGEAARIRYENGSGAQIDIIRAKLEESNVRHDVLMQRGNRDRALAVLRARLNLPADTVIPSFKLTMPMGRHTRAIDVSLNATTPAIAVLEQDVTRAEEDIQLARLLRKPDVSVDASYGFRPQQKDMFSLMGRIELPIRKSAIEPRLAEATARRDEARLRIDVLRQQLTTALEVAQVERNEAAAELELHADDLVPEARLAFQSALASYQAGRVTFEAVLGALQSYRTLAVGFYDVLRRLLVAQAAIDAIQHGATSGSSASVSVGGGGR